MSVHYKFKNTLAYEPVKFDGVYISAAELKNKIIQQKKLGQSELQLENEETGQSYSDDQQIPKNTNIIVSRLPFANSNKKTRLASQPFTSRYGTNPNSSGSINNNNNSSNNHHNNNHHHNNHHHNNSHHNRNNSHHNNQSNNGTSNSSSGAGGIASSSSGAPTVTNTDLGGGREALELVSTKPMSEEEKIKHIQSQSTREFEPSRYARGGRGASGGHRAAGGRNLVPGSNYTCRKCFIPGHFITDCKAGLTQKAKRASGIPRDFLVPVDPKEKGALMTPSGEYAMSKIDLEAYRNPKKEKAPFFEDGTPSDEKQLQGCQ